MSASKVASSRYYLDPCQICGGPIRYGSGTGTSGRPSGCWHHDNPAECRVRILAQARAQAPEIAELRARVVEVFKTTCPPYVFTENERVLLPGMETTHVNDVIRDVWRHAEMEVLAVIDGEQ